MPTSTYDVATEIALVAFTIAVAYSFKRLFIDTSFFVPIAAVAIAAHVTVAAVRWARAGLLLSAAISTAAFAVVAWVLFPPTTLDPDAGLRGEVIGGYVTDMELVWEQFRAVTAPAVVTSQFLLVIAIVIWTTAFLSDWAAFRLRSPGEALIPGSAVFVFGAFFAADQARVETTVLLLGAALAVVLFHRLGETSTAGTWLGDGAAERGQASLLRVGLCIVAVTLVGGVGIAQALPGYDEPPIDRFDPKSWDEPEDPRVVVSPLVDIQSRLINQPDVEVFTVRSEERDYWRLTSLDVFDGRTWRSRGSFGNASGGLDTNLPDGVAFDPVIQTFNISRLSQIWLPAAYEPAEILAAPDDIGLEYEPESGTLIVNRDQSDSDGLSYTLLSAIPNRDAATVSSGGGEIPDEIAERYLGLPPDFSERIRQQAVDVIVADGAETPYEKALALQNFFRDPALFSYSLEVSEGHRTDRIEDFLFEVRVGYCEQFAGSYAAMARSIGLPARIAVGFTPGEYDETIDAYRVTGKHAHAWPEVWIDGSGWTRFEPTPGRGAPGDEAYTGQPEAQESAAGGTNSPTTTAATSAVNPTEDRPNATTIPQAQEGQAATTTTAAPTSDRSNGGIIGGEVGLTSTLVFKALAILAAIVFVAVSPLAVATWRSQRQYRSIVDDPRKRIGLAWAESQSALRLMGLTVSASETPHELVQRVQVQNPEAALVLQPLATEVTNVTFAGDTVKEDRAIGAEQVPATLALLARASIGRSGWWWRHANPINVWRDKVGTWRHLRS